MLVWQERPSEAFFARREFPLRLAPGDSDKTRRVDLSTLANVATALTVLTAVAFGLLEARQERAERAAFAAVQAMLTPEWIDSMIAVHNIPDGSSAPAIEADAKLLAAAHSVGVILEGLGYSVYARIVPLRVVGDLCGGTVRLAWRKCALTSKKSADVLIRRKLLSGFNGSPHNWSDIRQEKLTWAWARTKHIKIGNPDDESAVCTLTLDACPAKFD